MTRIASPELVACLLAGCGGGGGGGSSPADMGSGSPSSITQQGVFSDGPVQGLSYATGSTSGTTDAQGRYTYSDGEQIQFGLGNITLPPVPARPYLDPYALFDAASFRDSRSVNLLRLLQTLDADHDPSNGISLSEAVRTAALAIQDASLFSRPDFDSQVQTGLCNTSSCGRPLSDNLDYILATMTLSAAASGTLSAQRVGEAGSTVQNFQFQIANGNTLTLKGSSSTWYMNASKDMLVQLDVNAGQSVRLVVYLKR